MMQHLNTNHIFVFLGVLGCHLPALRLSPGYVVSHCHCTDKTLEKTTGDDSACISFKWGKEAKTLKDKFVLFHKNQSHSSNLFSQSALTHWCCLMKIRQ